MYALRSEIETFAFIPGISLFRSLSRCRSVSSFAFTCMHVVLFSDIICGFLLICCFVFTELTFELAMVTPDTDTGTTSYTVSINIC